MNIATGLLIFFNFILPVLVFAQAGFPAKSSAGIDPGAYENVGATANIALLIDKVIDWLFGLLLALVGIFVIIGAYLFLAAAGNPAKVADARSFIIYALVALVIAFASRGIAAVVKQVLFSSRTGGNCTQAGFCG